MKKHDRAGEVLKQVRENLDLTQYEFAHKLNVHPQMVSNWERGLCSPPKNKLKKIFAEQEQSMKQSYVVCAILDNKSVLLEEFKKAGLVAEAK